MSCVMGRARGEEEEGTEGVRRGKDDPIFISCVLFTKNNGKLP